MVESTIWYLINNIVTLNRSNLMAKTIKKQSKRSAKPKKQIANIPEPRVRLRDIEEIRSFLQKEQSNKQRIIQKVRLCRVRH